MSKKTKIYAACYVQNMSVSHPTRIETQLVKAYLMLKKQGVHYPEVLFRVLTHAQGFGFKRFMRWAKTSGYNNVAGNSSPTIKGNAHLNTDIIVNIIKQDLGTYNETWVRKSLTFSKERLDYSVPLDKYDIQEPAYLYLLTNFYEYPSDVEGYEPVEGKEFIPYAEIYQSSQCIEVSSKDDLIEKQCSIGFLDLNDYCNMLIITKHKERTTFFLTHDLEPNYTFETLTSILEETLKGSLNVTVPEGEEPPDYAEINRLLSYYDEVRAKFGEVAKDKTYIRVNWLDGPGGNPINEVEYIVITSNDYDPEAQYLAYIYLLRRVDKITTKLYMTNDTEQIYISTKSTLHYSEPKLLLNLMKYPTGIPEIDNAFNNQTILGNDFAPSFSIRNGFWITDQYNYWCVQGCRKIYNDEGAYPRIWKAAFTPFNPQIFFMWLTFGIPITCNNQYTTAYKYSFWKHLWNTWDSKDTSNYYPIVQVQDWEGYIIVRSAYPEWYIRTVHNKFGVGVKWEFNNHLVMIHVYGMSPNDDWRKYPQIAKFIHLPPLSGSNYWIVEYWGFKLTNQTVLEKNAKDENTHAGASVWYSCNAMMLTQQLQWESIQYGRVKDSSHKKGSYWETTTLSQYFYIDPNLPSYFRKQGEVTTDFDCLVNGTQIPSSNTEDPNQRLSLEPVVTYYHQVEDDEYEFIKVRQPKNLQFVFGLGWTIYTPGASNFLIPITYNSIKDMSLIKWTNATQWVSNLKYTTFQTVKKWGGFTGVIMGIVTVVGCVVAAWFQQWYLIPIIIGASAAISTIFKIPNIAVEAIAKALKAVFGFIIDVFGKFLGTILAIVIIVVISYFLGPQNSQLIWNSSTVTTAVQVLSCTAAAVNTYSTIKMDTIQKELKKEKDLNTSFKTLIARKQQQIEDAYKSNNIRTDAEHAMLVAEFWQYWQYKRNACSAEVETLDHFLNRTLMTGTEIAQTTLNNVYNFTDGTLSLECDKPLILG